MLTEEKLGFNRKFLIGGNLGLLAWVFLAFLSVLLYNQIAGWIYLLLLAFLIYVVLRRIGCSNCYKCKTCTSGFGRLAGVFFGKGLHKKRKRWQYAWLYCIHLCSIISIASCDFGFVTLQQIFFHRNFGNDLPFSGHCIQFSLLV